MERIVLLMAMSGEAEPLLETLELAEGNFGTSIVYPFRIFKGIFQGAELFLVTSGKDPHHQVDNVGTIPAALMCHLAIESFQPQLVVNAGTAGGIGGQGCTIGDVYLSAGELVFHDRRIPLPGFDDYGLGNYSSFDTVWIADRLGLKRGVVSTGDSLDMVPRDLEIITESGAIIKDMEAAAIAWVCNTLQVPMFAIKAITDLIDEPEATEEVFMKNLNLAARNLQVETKRVLELLIKSFHVGV